MSKEKEIINRSLRVHPLAISSELLLKGREPVSGHIVNLSQTGVYFRATDDVDVLKSCEQGELGRLRFTVPGEIAVVDLAVRLRWSQARVSDEGTDFSGCGLEFEGLSEEALGLLQRYVAWFESMKAKLDALDPAD